MRILFLTVALYLKPERVRVFCAQEDIQEVLCSVGIWTIKLVHIWVRRRFSESLATTFPHLNSHSTNPNILVSQVMQDGLLLNLWNRLNSVASSAFDVVLSLLQDFRPSDAPHDRYLTNGWSFSSWNAYRLHSVEPQLDLNTCLWDRLNSKAKLLHKTIIMTPSASSVMPPSRTRFTSFSPAICCVGLDLSRVACATLPWTYLGCAAPRRPQPWNFALGRPHHAMEGLGLRNACVFRN